MAGMLRIVLVAGGIALLTAGSVAAWRLTRPPPPVKASAERRFDEISTAEHEQWLQDLGYTD